MGICSTTYGDLVCRGCKRFAHEIVQWNAYDETQQTLIWERLRSLRDEVVVQHVVVVDNERFETFRAQPAFAELKGGELLYAVTRKLGVAGEPMTDAGLAGTGSAEIDDALAVLKRVDAEIYSRSKAHYERNFKVPA